MRLARPRSLSVTFSSLRPSSSAITLAAGEDRDVLEHRLAAIAEARRLHRGAVQRAADLVHHQRRQRLALDVLGDDAAAACRCLAICSSTGSRSFMALIFFSWMRMYGILEHDFHALGIGDEVRRQVAAVELHALDHFERGLEALRLLDRDHAFLADLLHRLGDDLADGACRRWRRWCRPGRSRRWSLVGFDSFFSSATIALDGLVDAALEAHRVVPGGDHLGALGVDGPRQHGGGGGAVAGDVGGLATRPPSPSARPCSRTCPRARSPWRR